MAISLAAAGEPGLQRSSAEGAFFVRLFLDFGFFFEEARHVFIPVSLGKAALLKRRVGKNKPAGLSACRHAQRNTGRLCSVQSLAWRALGVTGD